MLWSCGFGGEGLCWSLLQTTRKYSYKTNLPPISAIPKHDTGPKVWHWWGEEDICPKGNRSNVPRNNPVDTCKYLIAQHITDNIGFLNIGKALKTSQRTECLWTECLTHLVHMGCVIWLVFWAFKDMICSSWTSGIKYNTYYCNWTAFQRPNFTTTLRYKGPAPVTTYNFCTFLTV